MSFKNFGIYLLGRIPLSMFWINVAFPLLSLGGGCGCSLSRAQRTSTPVLAAGVGCGLFLLSLVMVGATRGDGWMALGWAMLPSVAWAVHSVDAAGGLHVAEGEQPFEMAPAMEDQA